MVSGELFFFQKLHEFNNIQYVAVTQNINTILYDCTISNLHINMLTTKVWTSIKCLKCLFCNSHMHSIYIQYTSHNKLPKAEATLVNTISSLFTILLF